MDRFDFKTADEPLADEKHDKWIDVLSIDWGATDEAVEAYAAYPVRWPETSQSGDDEAEDSITIDYGAVLIDYDS